MLDRRSRYRHLQSAGPDRASGHDSSLSRGHLSDFCVLKDITPRRQNGDEKLKSIQFVAIIHSHILVKLQVSFSEFELVKRDRKYTVIYRDLIKESA